MDQLSLVSSLRMMTDVQFYPEGGSIKILATAQIIRAMEKDPTCPRVKLEGKRFEAGRSVTFEEIGKSNIDLLAMYRKSALMEVVEECFDDTFGEPKGPLEIQPPPFGWNGYDPSVN